MQTPRLLLVSALLAVCASDIAPPLEARARGGEANVRFINRLSADATISANGTAVFTKVTSGSVTGWSAVRDTVTTFTLTLGRSDTIRATTSALLANGSHYTISATAGNEGGVVFAVLRDNGPDDTVNIARPKAVVVKP